MSKALVTYFSASGVTANVAGRLAEAINAELYEIKQRQKEKARLAKERRMQEAQLRIKQRFGKNAILRGLNFQEGATAKERNKQIGGHKA